MQKVRVKGHSVLKLEWKQTDVQTDGGDCVTRLANAVGKNSCLCLTEECVCYSECHKLICCVMLYRRPSHAIKCQLYEIVPHRPINLSKYDSCVFHEQPRAVGSLYQWPMLHITVSLLYRPRIFINQLSQVNVV